jgi:hypothetical protein
MPVYVLSFEVKASIYVTAVSWCNFALCLQFGDLVSMYLQIPSFLL